MKELIAKTDRQLGTALKILYNSKTPYTVSVAENEKGKIEFRIAVDADEEKFSKIKSQYDVIFS